ncbi:PEPxxWA-CTERM sorting domain-containing protein [Sphingomonas sp. RRHST34]|uniref:PEPxxWA-CTERM sorting domain-containing protein n=1 Tax=Sphingomonas citri TaxID=2862499 RepID=A0ABS7BPT2_9SPHN|nr:PEPxxWA-CTERM sorting domain-containing protein [Sphingomonas citri]
MGAVTVRKLAASFLLGIAALAGTPAAAATLVGSVPGAPDPGASGALTLDFEGALPAGIVFAAGSTYQILQGFQPKQGYAPAGDLTRYLSVPGGGVAGSATLDFTDYVGAALGDFSFYWGSIDRANELIVETSAGVLSVLGSDLITRGYGSETSATGNRRVAVALAAGETLRRLTFSSPTSFELDDIVFQQAAGGAVPEPATWMTMIAGLGLVGAMLRRRARRGAAA